MWKSYWTPATLTDALDLLDRFQGAARLIAGGTDLLIELDRGVRRLEQVIDISRLPDLDRISLDADGIVHLGPLVTHNDVVASALCVAQAFPLAQACREVGAPQIRNRATIAGNLITASPANDTITPLMALEAVLTLRSAQGERQVPLSQFYTGVRKTVLQPNEMLVDIAFKALNPDTQHGCYLKLGLRRAQAISVVNCAVVVEDGGRGTDEERRRTGDGGRGMEDERPAASDQPPATSHQPPATSNQPPATSNQPPATSRQVKIALGAVAPTIVRAGDAEAFLAGKVLTDENIREAARLAAQSVNPITDIRASADYRRDMVEVLVRRALSQAAVGVGRGAWDEAPVRLEIGAMDDLDIERLSSAANDLIIPSPHDAISTVVNGNPYVLTDPAASHKTLLRLLREDCNLIGTKEGCAEGECGACTVLLDGNAVMSCLVPAGRAHGARVVTVEGVAGVERGATDPESRPALHALQQAFIDCGAVQCGYCTPGFIVSGVALLAEQPQPSEAQIKEAFSGNLCRCTGYYKIIEAVRQAMAPRKVA